MALGLTCTTWAGEADCSVQAGRFWAAGPSASARWAAGSGCSLPDKLALAFVVAPQEHHAVHVLGRTDLAAVLHALS